jgi:hypothetical protein
MQSLGMFGGGVGAEGIKELGGGELAQNLTELGANLGPDIVRNQLVPRIFGNVGQEESRLIEGARRLGLTEQEAALTLNQRGLGKDQLQEISSKGGRLVNRFQKTKNALSRVWDTLRNTPEAQTAISTQGSQQMVNDISNRLSRLPAQQRNLITEDFQDLLASNMTGGDVIDFWQKLNYYIRNGEHGFGHPLL